MYGDLKLSDSILICDIIKAMFVLLTISFTILPVSPPQDSWEIVEGLRGLSAIMQEPDRQEGFLLKRRKWPMKGWHKVSPSEVPLMLHSATTFTENMMVSKLTKIGSESLLYY